MNFDAYQSPFSWRYASPEMRQIWGETNRRLVWRRLWVALAEAQQALGMVSAAQVADLKAHQQEVDLDRALEIEAEIHHDLMAEVRAYAEQCPLGGGILHLGATSMDIKDNADVLLIRQALNLVLARLDELLAALAAQVEQYADLPCLGFTHLQPAEPTTFGYRLALYAQDLMLDRQGLRSVRRDLRGKGFRGAVGTAASYIELFGREGYALLEQRLADTLELPFFTATSQTYPRKQDYRVLQALADLAGSLYHMAFDLRLLQSPVIGEAGEPFAAQQVGSSAMPFKRNPIKLEEIDSLARALAQMPRLAWDNAAHSLLERTLDDSANRRSLLPEAFLIADELLLQMVRIARRLQVNPAAMSRNLEIYAPFAATERLLMELVKRGADRQAAHELIRALAIPAWEAIQRGEANPLVGSLLESAYLRAYIPPDELQALLTVEGYLGLAPEKAREIATEAISDQGLGTSD